MIVEHIVVVIGFALLHWYALTEKKHTSFSTEHKLCKSAIVFWVPFKKQKTKKQLNNGQNNSLILVAVALKPAE